MEIIWSPRSIEKIQEIGDYIAKDSPERAHAFIDRLLESVERLLEFPMSGQVTRENPAFRQVVVQGYRLIYRVTANIEVVTVIAPKRDADTEIDKKS